MDWLVQYAAIVIGGCVICITLVLRGGDGSDFFER